MRQIRHDALTFIVPYRSPGHFVSAIFVHPMAKLLTQLLAYTATNNNSMTGREGGLNTADGDKDKESKIAELQGALELFTNLVGGLEDMMSLALTLATDKGSGLGRDAQDSGLDLDPTPPSTIDPLGMWLNQSGVGQVWLEEHVVEILDQIARADFLPGNPPYQFTINTPSQHTLSTHLSIHSINTPSQPSQLTLVHTFYSPN